MGTGGRAPVERLVDLAVAIPVSVAAAARQLLPIGVTRLERRVARDLVLIRRYARTRAAGGASAPAERTAAAGPAPEAGDAVTVVAPGVPAGEVVADAELPIDGYDQLSARQIVDRLRSLTADELAAVDAYERAHRRRQTVLARIAQLT